MIKKYLAIALFAVAGCSSAPTRVAPPASQASPIDVTVRERSPVFYKENNGNRTIAADTYKPRVDYQSQLEIQVKPVESTLPSNLPPLTPEQQKRLDALAGIDSQARTYFKLYTDYHAARQRSMISAPADQVTALHRLRDDTVIAANELDKRFHAYFASINATQDEIKKSTDPIFPITSPVYTPVDLAALADFIDTKAHDNRRATLADAKTVKDASNYLRIRAILTDPGHPPAPLHVLNYDNLSDSNVLQDARISTTMSANDKARLEAENKVDLEAAQFITDLRSGKTNIGKSLDSIYEDLKKDLKSFTDLPDLSKKLTDILNSIDAAQTSTLTADGKALANSLKTTLKEIQDDLKTLDQLKDVDQKNGPDLVSLASTTVSTLAHLEGLVDLTKSESITTDLTKLLADINALPQNEQVNLQALTKAIAPETVTGIKTAFTTVSQKYPAITSLIADLIGQQAVVAAATKVTPIESDPNLIDVLLSQNPPSGFISLEKNVAHGGETVSVETAMIHKDPADPTKLQVVPGPQQDFDVEKLGLISDWSANLIFVERIGTKPRPTKADPMPKERFDSFQPAASISWTLHYNPPPDKVWPAWWDGVYPGAGLNVAAVNFEGSGVQVGVGGHISFAHDLLMVGVGYDLNESYHGGYYFIGLSLFTALQDLGINVGGAGTANSLPVGR